MDTQALLRRGNKIPTEGDTEKTYGAEYEGKTIQRLHQLGIHPIYPDTILDAHKCLLSGTEYSYLLGSPASA